MSIERLGVVGVGVNDGRSYLDGDNFVAESSAEPKDNLNYGFAHLVWRN
jgi:hypothetical protein